MDEIYALQGTQDLKSDIRARSKKESKIRDQVIVRDGSRKSGYKKADIPRTNFQGFRVMDGAKVAIKRKHSR